MGKSEGQVQRPWGMRILLTSGELWLKWVVGVNSQVTHGLGTQCVGGFPSARNTVPRKHRSVAVVIYDLVLAFREAKDSRIPVHSSEC